MVLTVKEVAELLGLSINTVYRLVQNAQIPHRQIRARGSQSKGKILFHKPAIERWLEGENN